jgi:hypothetical protein
MHSILEATRKRAFDLVAHAYSCISAENFSSLVGMPPADAINGEPFDCLRAYLLLFV